MTLTPDIGCLLIDDLLSGPGALEPLLRLLTASGVRAGAFAPGGDAPLHEQLQRAYQRVRRDGAVNAIVGRGAGCDCALALAGQLPADRLALIEPLKWRDAGGMTGPLNRVRRYGLRGAAFCVAQTLIAPGPRTPERLPDALRSRLCNSAVTVLWPGAAGPEALNTSILHFLRHGVLPKSLAENPEMCIIYG